VLYIPIAVLDVLAKTRPGLARDVGTAIDSRQQLGAKVLLDACERPSIGALVITSVLLGVRAASPQHTRGRR
jgi:hypothetical protein